jgi:hypothetical protein
VDHFLSPSLGPALVHAEMIRRPGFRHDGPLPPGAWLPSDHLQAMAEVG